MNLDELRSRPHNRENVDRIKVEMALTEHLYKLAAAETAEQSRLKAEELVRADELPPLPPEIRDTLRRDREAWSVKRVFRRRDE
ncbi:hypothetical protein TPB0596_42180 [Tsukamurella pulmonis]|nr:hypothetical protein TPB0596_42180 [Tsukamurella pulmonis]